MDALYLIHYTHFVGGFLSPIVPKKAFREISGKGRGLGKDGWIKYNHVYEKKAVKVLYPGCVFYCSCLTFICSKQKHVEIY